MADAANIQIRIDTSDAEKAEKVLAALENRSDKLYQAFANLDKGTSFDRLKTAATGVNTSFDKLKAANDSVATSFAGLDRQADAANDALLGVSSNRAMQALEGTAKAASSAGTSLALIDKSQTDIALNDIAANASKADAAFDKIGIDNVTSDFGELRKAANGVGDDLDEVSAAAKKADTSLDSTSKKGIGLRDSFNAVKIAVATVTAALGATVGVFVNLSDRYQSMNAGLKIVTDGTEEFQTAQAALIQSAKDTRSPLEDVSRLYAGMAPSLGEMGRAQEEVLRVTELVSKALKIGGGAAGEHTAALQQFTQAMGSGVLRGDEFNSIMENGRGLALQLAEGLGVPVGALREMAEAGELSADRVVDALLRQGTAIDEIFDDLPVTSGQAWTLVKNQALLSIGEIDDSLGIAQAWSGLLVGVAESMEGLFDNVNDTILDVKAEWISFQLNLQTSDDTAYKAIRAVGEAIESIGAAIAPAMPYVSQFAGALATISAGYGGYLLVASAITGIGTAFSFMAAAVVANPIVASIAAIGAAAYVIYDNWDGIVEWWDGIWTSIKEATVGAVASVVETAQNFGTDLIDNIKAGIDSRVDLVKNAVVDTFDFLPGVGREIEAEAEEIGENIPQGTENGILSRLGSLFGVGQEAGETAIDGLADGAGTQSPSWKAFDIGSWTGEGMANGLTDSGSLIQAAATEVSEDAIRTFDRIMGGLDDQITAFVGVTEGARKYGEEWKKLDAAQQASISEKERILEQLEMEKRLRDELSDGITQSLVNADSVEDAFKNLGDFMEEWLREKIALFAANQISVSLGLGEVTGGGDLASVGGILKGAAQNLGLLGSSASAASGSFGVLASNVNGAGGSFGVLASDINAAGTTASGAAGGFGVLGAALGGAGLGYAIGELGGAANSTAVSITTGLGAALGSVIPIIGTWAGGALGAAVGSAFGGSWEHIDSGLELAFQEGDLTGKSYKYFEKERSGWRGTATRIIYEELDSEVADGLTRFMRHMNDTITGLASDMGIAGAEKLMQSFSVATQRINGEEEMTAFTNRVSLGAYRALYDGLGPAMQSAIDGVVDTSLGSVERLEVSVGGKWGGIITAMENDILNAMNDEEVAAAVAQWEAALSEVSVVIYDLVPLMQGAGISLGATTDEIQANAFEFAESVGGASVAVGLMTGFLEKVAPAGTLAAISLENAKKELDDWNISLGRMTGNTMNSTASFTAWTEGLDSTTQSGSVMLRMIDTLTTSIDSTTGAITLNLDGLDNMIAGMEATGTAGSATYDTLVQLRDAYTGTGDAAITTSQGMYDYAMSLDQTTEAGRQAFLAAVAVADSMLLVEQENERLAGVLDTVNDAYSRLNLTVGATSPLTAEAADALVELAGGMDEFTRKTNFLYENFYSEQERATLELQAATAQVEAWNATLSPLTLQLAGVTDGSVDTAEELRLVSDYLLQTGQYGSQAWVDLLNVSESLLVVSTAGEEAAEAAAALATDLTATFDQMRIDAGESTTGLTTAVVDSLQGIVTEAQTSGVEMHLTLADSFGQILADAGLTAEQLPQPLQDAYAAMSVTGAQIGETLTGATTATSENVLTMVETWRAGLQSAVENTGLQGTDMNASLLAAFDEMITNATFTGTEMDRNLALSFQNVLNNAGIAAADLPPALQAGLDAMLGNVANAATDLGGTSADMFIHLNAMRETWQANLDDVVAAADNGGEETRLALDAAFSQMITDAMESGGELNTEMRTAFDAMLERAGITADELPPALQAGLDALTSAAGTAATGLGESADSVSDELGGLGDSADDLGVAANTAAGDTERSAGDIIREMGASTDYMTSVMEQTTAAMRSMTSSLVGNLYEGNRKAIQYANSFGSAFSTMNDAISRAANAARSAAGAFSSARSSYDGSHAGGLDYVPFDGYIAQLHKGEAVLTAAEATEYRAAANEATFVAPITNTSQSNNAAMLSELQAMRKESAAMRQELEQLRAESGAALGSIANSGQQQVGVMSKVEKENQRLGRKIEAALS